MAFVVYQITNKKNGKYYRGKTTIERWVSRNYMGSGDRILKAIKKYGRKAFTREILESFSDEESAYGYEQVVVTLGKDDPMSYNIVAGGNGWKKGEKHKPTTIAKLKVIGREREFPPERIENHRRASLGEKNPMFGKHHKQSTRDKISASKSGENHHMFGKHQSKETIAKRVEKISGENHYNFGKSLPEDVRKKIGEGSRRAWAKIRLLKSLKNLKEPPYGGDCACFAR